MNIKQAKQIPIGRLVAHLGGIEGQTKGEDTWYHSPFRPDEKTPSFKVNRAKNTWYDFGLGAGGSIIDLWIDHKGLDRKDSQALKSSLEALSAFSGDNLPQTANMQAQGQPSAPTAAKPPHQRFELVKPPTRIWHDGLKTELERRRISPSTAQPYLKQAYFQDNETGKKLYGFAFVNDRQGYEVSVPNPQRGKSFKTALGAKYLSTLHRPESETVLLFEGFWDYLSYLELTRQTRTPQEVIVLNTLSFVREAAQQIIAQKERLKTVVLFQDNDPAGEEALALLADLLEPEGFQVGTMAYLYPQHKDVSDYWMDTAHRQPLAEQVPNFVTLQPVRRQTNG